MTRCVVCNRPVDGASLLTDELHPGCFAERLPHDAGVALVAAAAIFLVPFIRVWSA